MESFFARMEPWRKSEGSLHLYVLPDEGETERFVDAQEPLAGIANLPLMPATYLHCTVQRLAQFDDDVTQAQYTRLGDALGQLCSEVAPFELEFGAPRADDVSVVCWAAPSKSWDTLVQGCRRTVVEAWGLDAPASPSAPHLSLAYARGAVSNDLVASRLAGGRNVGTVSVRTLHLVSVTVRPERGTFDFTSLANWDLG